MNRKIMVVYGTRPEAIKLAPLVQELLTRKGCETLVCLTGQHREMLEQINAFFEIKALYDLHLMKENQSLVEFTANAMLGLQKCLNAEKPDLVVVQGDTSTVLAAAVSAYYNKVQVAHVEAGLRSFDLNSPFPEEGNRLIASRLSWLHFAPTADAAANLRREGISERVYTVGNTIVDAVQFARRKLETSRYKEIAQNYFRFLDPKRRVIAITGHRRESFGTGFQRICDAILRLSIDFPDVQFVYPVHLNPNVRRPVSQILSKRDNIFLLEPLDYPLMIWLLEKCYLVLTDSGGIQEEAPAFGKPTLVMREKTERMEGVTAGVSRLVGADEEKIYTSTKHLLQDPEEYKRMSRIANPYGDGMASKRIADVLLEDERWFVNSGMLCSQFRVRDSIRTIQ